MFRNRFLILLSLCFLAASATWADDVGFVDCSNHPEATQVFGKPRKTPDVVASVPCGERFTILVYGFVFSRIQTGDGTVGYVYSSVIAVDRAATAAQHSGSIQMAAAKTKIPSTRPPAAQPAPPAAAPSQPAPAQPAPVQTPDPASSASLSNPETVPTVAAANPPAPAQPAPASISSVPESSAPVAQPAPPTPAQPQPTPAPLIAAPSPEPPPPAPASNSSGSISNVPDPPAPAAPPDRSAPAQPQPEPAQPARPSIRPANDRTTWERPAPGGRRIAPLIELFGGYSFARLAGSAGSSTNLNGAMGSFGWNPRPWLQIVGDSSYNFVTVSGTKTVLYGNHFGPRYFHRSRNRWGLTPFVEGLVGGSRSDITVAGATTSTNCLSYKAGGGLDIHPSRRLDIRLFDVDYYRTAFGTNLHQNNYWATTGIVIRLFGGGSQ
jgi:hypothetical protein